MSNNTLNAGLRRLGYTTDDQTAHGFRSMASTLLNEQGWNRDAIERQLAHGERDDRLVSRRNSTSVRYRPLLKPPHILTSNPVATL